MTTRVEQKTPRVDLVELETTTADQTKLKHRAQRG